MTSQDSLLPSPPERSELEARVAEALRELRSTHASAQNARTYERATKVYAYGVGRVVAILDTGRTS